MALCKDPEGLKSLSNILAACFDVFPLYGKEPEAADNIRRTFQQQLAEYPIDKIQQAFTFYMGMFTTFPTPAHIRQIIMRGGNKPPFEPAMYDSFCRIPMDLRTHEQWQYIKDYERFRDKGEM